MDATPEVNSREFYRAQIRKKLDQQDAFLHRQAILTIEDMRRKGTYRGMTRDMTLEEKQVCLEIEMANLGIDSEEDELDSLSDCVPSGTISPKSQKSRSCSPAISNRQPNSDSANITDSVESSSKDRAKQQLPNSPRVNSGAENFICPATADVPPHPFATNTQRDAGEMNQKVQIITRQKVGTECTVDSDSLIQSRHSSCQGDVESNKQKSKSIKSTGSISSKVSNESNRTFVTSGSSKGDKNSGRKVKHRPPAPPKLKSLSEEEIQQSYRIRQNATRRREHRKL